ncbi:MAG TPA: 6-phosphogluconolactonase [Chryseolinea sp.]|nr:6-phosphogluconolactonase [Chryseolinea sp.]
MIKIYDTPDLLITALADFVVQTAKDSIQLRGKFDFVLSGGSSPKRLYELLASDSHRELIDWSRVCFFFGDERNVPHDHPDSNYLMVTRALFQPLTIADKQIFPINTAKMPTQAATDYEQLVRNHFEPGHYGFDLILLGLGDNSHTASLFPHTAVLHEQHALVKEVFVPEVNMYRITLTAPLINAGRNVAFLVYGASKAEAVYHIIKGERNIESHPAQLIKPSSGKLMWFLDQEAAKKL